MVDLCAYLVLVLDYVSCGRDRLASCTTNRQVALCWSSITFGIGDYQSGDVLAVIFLDDSDVLQEIKHWLPAVI